MTSPINVAMEQIMLNNGSLVSSARLAISQLSRDQTRTLAPGLARWAKFFLSTNKSLSQLFYSSVRVSFVIYLDPELYTMLTRFKSDTDAPIVQSDRDSLYTQLFTLFADQAPFLVFDFIPASETEPAFCKSTLTNCYDSIRAHNAGKLLPSEFKLDNIESTDVKIDILSVAGHNYFKTCGVASPVDLLDLTNLTISRPTEALAPDTQQYSGDAEPSSSPFDDNLEKSPLISRLSQDVAFLVETMRAQMGNQSSRSAPSPTSDSAHNPGERHGVIESSEVAFIAQSEATKQRTENTLGTQVLFDDDKGFTDLYGKTPVPNITNAYELLGPRLEDVFKCLDPKPQFRKPLLLFQWQTTATSSSDFLHLFSLCPRPTFSFQSEPTFFLCRISIAEFAREIFGDILADSVLALFDSIYRLMIDYKTISWLFIEKFLVTRLNRVRLLRTLDRNASDFSLADELSNIFAVDFNSLEYFLQSSRLPDRPIDASAIRPSPVSRDTDTTGDTVGALRHESLSTKSPRKCNFDWPRDPSAHTSLCKVEAHPCYYWALCDTDHPCPNGVAAVKCPHPHNWPARCSAKSTRVLAFLTWLRQSKLL
jgi:hypothetical protein